jgi:hypothetical protein
MTIQARLALFSDLGQRLPIASKLLRNVLFDNGHLIQFLYPLRLILHLVVLLEVRYVLGVYEVLLPCILVMISANFPSISTEQAGRTRLGQDRNDGCLLLPVMNLVLVLVVSVVPWTQTEIWQLAASSTEIEPLLQCDLAVCTLI